MALTLRNQLVNGETVDVTLEANAVLLTQACDLCVLAVRDSLSAIEAALAITLPVIETRQLDGRTSFYAWCELDKRQLAANVRQQEIQSLRQNLCHDVDAWVRLSNDDSTEDNTLEYAKVLKGKA